MFSYSYDDLYNETKNIVNKSLNKKVPEDQIEELTRTLAIIFKNYIRSRFYNYADQCPMLINDQSFCSSTFNSANPIIFQNTNYSFIHTNLQLIPPSESFLFNNNPKRKRKINKKNNHRIKNITKSSKSKKHTKKTSSDSLISENNSTPSFNYTTNTFSSYIYKILKKVHSDLEISTKAMIMMNAIVGYIFERIALQGIQLSNTKNREILDSADIKAAIRLALPNGLAQTAINEGENAELRLTSDENWMESPSETIFPAALIRSLLCDGKGAKKVDDDVPVFMAASLQSIVEVVIEIAGDVASRMRKGRIAPPQILGAIKSNFELNQFLEKTVNESADAVRNLAF